VSGAATPTVSGCQSASLRRRAIFHAANPSTRPLRGHKVDVFVFWALVSYFFPIHGELFEPLIAFFAIEQNHKTIGVAGVVLVSSCSSDNAGPARITISPELKSREPPRFEAPETSLSEEFEARRLRDHAWVQSAPLSICTASPKREFGRFRSGFSASCQRGF